MKTLIIASTNLGPYHLARFTALANEDLELTVVLTPVKEKYRPWDVDFSNINFSIDQPFKNIENHKG